MPSLLSTLVIGFGLGFIVGAALAGLGVIWARHVLDGYTEHVKAEAVSAALGMVKDITQTRAAMPASAHPILDAIEVEERLFLLARQRADQERIARAIDGKGKA